MTNQSPPIKFQQLLELTQLGINKNEIKFTNISISHSYVVVREENKVLIINISTRNVTPLNVKVDSALAHPSANIIALRSNKHLQIFNLDTKVRMNSIQSSDPIIYWKWLNEQTIAYITTKSVYHFSINNDKPLKKFDFSEERQIQITGYDASVDGNWLYLQGIARSSNNVIEGVTQLYNVPLNRYQPKMNAYGSCFAYLNINGRDATLFCFAKKDGLDTKLFIVEVGNPNNPLRVQSNIQFQQENDWIVSLVPSKKQGKYGCIYAISLHAVLYLYDLQTGRCICSRRVSNSTMLLGIPHADTDGIITVDRSGRVALFYADPDNYVSYIMNVVGDAKLGVTLATRYNLCGASNIFKSRFDQLMCQGQYQQAAKLSAAAPQGVLRNGMNTIGLSIGGAKDVNNFRECIKNNMMPSIGSITYNGLLSEYYFDTETRESLKYMNKNDEKKDDAEGDGSMLFYPTYCYAKTNKMKFLVDDEIHPNKDDEYEYYMTVGLNSNLKMDEFKRKHLNLMIILDQSGSMGSRFYGDDVNKTKMEIANESVVSLLKHLTNKDRFGMVMFDNSCTIIQSLQRVNTINMDELKNKILSIKERGGTNFECGYRGGYDLYQQLFEANIVDVIDVNEYENRIIFLTDAQPNTGITDPNSLLGMVSTYANDVNIHHRVYTTFIGIGLDFNSNLIGSISKTRGCNYYSVKSTSDFNETMTEDFDYMVTPLVFNVSLKLKCEGNVSQIDKVYGSHNADDIIQNGEITRIETLFPAKKRGIEKGGGTKGGIQLIKLKKNDPNKNMNVEIEVSFEDRNGKKYKNKQNVTFITPKKYKNYKNDMIENDDGDNFNFYDNLGIRKGILLCKYSELMMEWIKNTSNRKLELSERYKKTFIGFLKYFKKEMKKCHDDELKREVGLMEKLINLDNQN